MTTYIYPPRANTCIPKEEGINFYTTIPNTIAQLKYNDSHLLLDYNMTGDKLTLTKVWDRHGGTLTYFNKPNKLTQNGTIQTLGDTLLTFGGPGRYLIDGGLLNDKHRAVKDVAVIWDILIQADKHLTGTTYQQRYNTLQNWLCTLSHKETPTYQHIIGSNSANMIYYDLGYQPIPGLILPYNIKPQDWPATWNMIEEINQNYDKVLIEGLVYKNLSGKLEKGNRPDNNAAWLGKSRITTKRSLC